MQLLMQGIQQSKQKIASNWNGVKSNVGGVLTATGGLINSYNQGENADVNTGIIGGAMSGGGAGFSRFGVLGGLFGGLLGGAMGGINSSIEVGRNLDAEKEAMLNKMYGSLVPGTSEISLYGKGGRVKSGDMLFVPIQASKMEYMYFPGDGTITKSFSKKEHSEMAKKEVTDVVPSDAFVFSDKVMLKKKDLETVVAYRVGDYDEGVSQFRFEPVTLKEYLGTDEISFADAAKKIGKTFNVVESDRYDRNLEATNDQNKKTRAILMDNLVYLHENRSPKTREKKELMEAMASFAYGGWVGDGIEDPMYPSTFRNDRRRPFSIDGYPEVAPIPTLGPSPSGMPTMPEIGMIAPPAPVPGTAAASPVAAPDLFAGAYDELTKREGDVNKSLQDSRDMYGGLFARANASNFAQLLANMGTAGLQDTKVTPTIKLPYYLQQKYRNYSPYEINTNVQSVAGAGVAAAKNLAENNVLPVMADYVLSKSMGEASRIGAGMVQQNRANEANMYGELGAINQFNDASRVASENQERLNKNAKTGMFNSSVGNFLSQDVGIAEKQAEISQGLSKDELAAKMTFANNRLSLDTKKMSFDYKRGAINDHLKTIESEFEMYQDQMSERTKQLYQMEIERLKKLEDIKKRLSGEKSK